VDAPHPHLPGRQHSAGVNPEHDGRLIADLVVSEWARLHGEPFTLILTGQPEANTVKAPTGQPTSVDAVQLCRILSGRAPP